MLLDIYFMILYKYSANYNNEIRDGDDDDCNSHVHKEGKERGAVKGCMEKFQVRRGMVIGCMKTHKLRFTQKVPINFN